ncbi:hypothetical protein MKX03_000979 [Papaver bracteatum]|nr:hypothetical protein MKX03_000979 [Papaver bracteatum]
MICLQKICDEVGESDGKLYKMRCEINQECLDIYKRKVNEAAKSRADPTQVSKNTFSKDTTYEALSKQLKKSLFDLQDNVEEDKLKETLDQIDRECLEVYERKAAEAKKLHADLHNELLAAKEEISMLALDLGVEIPTESTGKVKKQLADIYLKQEHLSWLKDKRKVLFADVRSQILKLTEGQESVTVSDNSDNDLSLSRLDLLQILICLQQLWDEVGESVGKRDEVLRQINQECSDIYTKNRVQDARSGARFSQVCENTAGADYETSEIERDYLNVYIKKVAKAAKSRELLNQELISAKNELSSLASALGMKTIHDKSTGTISKQLAAIRLKQKNLAVLKDKRKVLFADVQLQIQDILKEIGYQEEAPTVNEDDLSFMKLDKLRSDLQVFQLKSDDFKASKVFTCVTTISHLCSVLEINFINDIFPIGSRGKQSQSINNGIVSELAKTVKKEELEGTLSKLTKMVEYLEREKKERFAMLQGLGTQLLDLWTIMMNTPEEEKTPFARATRYIAAEVKDVILPGDLGICLIKHSQRLKVLKARDYIRTLDKLCSSLELDFFSIINGVHPGLLTSLPLSKIVNDKILSELATEVERLSKTLQDGVNSA